MFDLTLNLNGIIAVLAIITAISIAYLANWWRNRKNLSYEIVADSPLLKAEEEIKEDLQILFKGEEVKDVGLLILKIINDGKLPIITGDFQKHLSLIFLEEVQILSAEIVSVNPNNLDASVIFEKNKLTLNPLLLNSTDFAEIKIIINSNNTEFKVDTRIIGVKEVKPVRKSWQNYQYPLISFGCLLFQWLIIYWQHSLPLKSYFIYVPYFAIIMGILLLISLYTVYKQLTNKK